MDSFELQPVLPACVTEALQPLYQQAEQLLQEAKEFGKQVLDRAEAPYTMRHLAFLANADLSKSSEFMKGVTGVVEDLVRFMNSDPHASHVHVLTHKARTASELLDIISKRPSTAKVSRACAAHHSHGCCFHKRMPQLE